MNRLFRLIGFGLFLLIIILVILGINSPANVQISQTDHLQAPSTLIWQYITDVEKTANWVNQIPIRYCVKDSDNFITCFADNKDNKIISKIKTQDKTKSLTLTLHDKWTNPYINEYLLIVNLKPLRDGTTEINCTLQYKLKNIMSKVVNKLYLEGYQRKLIEKNFNSLQKHFGRV